MSKANWQKLNEIFAVAIEMDAGAQSEFLGQITDENLRREAEAILAASRRADVQDFLAADAFAAGARILAGNDKKGAPVAKQIGKYKIVQEIGRGGMGAIYLAEREDFQHRVALKIIKRGMDTDEIIRRFERERQVLAALNHPFIARLLDGGATDDGLPFLVMEYVEGAAITDFCEENALNIEERLALFRKVCAAVAFAHRNLIVHRDLKPSNILVDKNGEPKLLDFGIAKLLAPEESEQTTETGFRLLTPEYASPEQLRGERVTTAADVYSLGVLLYELLTGHRPHKITSRNAAEIIRAVCETLPERPSSVVSRPLPDGKNITSENKGLRTKDHGRLTKSLKGDLDNIILKALRKETAERYSSVEQFAEDIGRYLTGLPVIARPATFGYKAAKFVERNRASVAFAGIALIALLAVTSAALWQAVVARRERARAEQRFNEVRKLANTLVSGWDKDIPESLVSNQVRGRIADISTEYLDNLARETDDAELLKELARAFITVGHEYSYQFVQEEKSRSSLSKAEAIARRLIDGSPDDPEAKQLLAECLHQYDFYFGERDRSKSLENRMEIVRLNEEILAAKPDDQRALYDLGGAYALYGLVLKFVGRREESLDYYARAAEIRQRRIKILERPAATTDDRAKLGNSYISLAAVQANELKDFESAVKNARRGAEIAEAFYAENPENQPALFAAGTAVFELGMILKKSGDARGSLDVFRKSLDLARQYLARVPGSFYFKRKEYDSLLEIAEALHESGAGDEVALAPLREAFDLRRKLTTSEKDALRTYGGHSHFFNAGGKLLARMKRTDEALDAFREAENAHLKISEAEPNQVLNRRNLAVLYLTLGDFHAGAGVCDFRQAKNFDSLSESSRYCPPESNDIAAASRARLREAREFYQKAVRLLTEFEAQWVAQFDDKENLRLGKEKIEFCEKKLNGKF